MTQRDLNRAVARATGETVQEINRRGFVPLADGPAESDSLRRLGGSENLELQATSTPALREHASSIVF